ncbi:MAG: ribose-phosphate pyrophosphokinase-like domain-containing protein, partial [Oscillospiraceae bacterium]|nr:ribose-phosphate pyrophosphokinase-like domain-containing protein [Oscillospiraceae bacterium]
MLEKVFKLKENNTNVKTEIAAGITTFMTMAYILAVNPSILSEAGMDANAVLIATCLASFIGTMCMSLMANMPFALSAGMGLNAYLAYTVVLGQGVSWQTALFAVFVEGIIFIIMSLTNVREAIFNSIPLTLKKGVSVGIGLFIAFIGLQNAGLAVDASTLVTITSFTENFSTHGICALLAVIGLFITCILHIRNVKGSILYGIVVTWGLGMLCQLAGIYVPDPSVGAYSLFPSGVMSADFSALGKTFGQCFNFDFSSVGLFNFIVIIFSFLFVDLFDTLGTLIGVGTKANMLDEDGRLPNIKPALLSDAIATSAGAVLGTSTTTTFVESSAGVAVGGRTGLTAATTAVLFLLATLFSPLFTSIPSFATAPALIFVGFLMFETVGELKFTSENLAEVIPAYLAIIAMPLFYSISEGICLGVISYVILQAATGKAKRINVVMPFLYEGRQHKRTKRESLDCSLALQELI